MRLLAVLLPLTVCVSVGCGFATGRGASPVSQAGLQNQTEQQQGDRVTVEVGKGENNWLGWIIGGIAVGGWMLPAPFDPIRRWHLQNKIKKINGGSH